MPNGFPAQQHLLPRNFPTPYMVLMLSYHPDHSWLVQGERCYFIGMINLFFKIPGFGTKRGQYFFSLWL